LEVYTVVAAVSFKWWFEYGPSRARMLATPKGGLAKHILLTTFKKVL
jgi:hypothetical protein